MPSNQGQELDALFDDLPVSVIEGAARYVWDEARAHPDTSSCFCPAVEAFAYLYSQGYKIVKA